VHASLLILVSAFTVTPTPADTTATVYNFAPEFQAAIRGQNPGYDEVPPSAIPNGAQPAPYVQPGVNYGETYPPMVNYDPFLNGPGMSAPLGMGGPAGGYHFGATGVQPFRFGWTTRTDMATLSKESADSPLGSFGVFEFNLESEYSSPTPDGWIFSTTPQFNLRTWDGPSGVGLPGSGYRFGWDFELATPANNAWSVQLGINPSVNSDFHKQLSSDAWNFDARMALFYRQNPQLMYAFGIAYLDRVDDKIIPLAGLVWTPDGIWEVRLMFPKPRISVFVGNWWGGPTWLYASGEYHIEAYEIKLRDGGMREQIQLEDWRIMMGVRSQGQMVTSFLEAGWVFNREAEFRRATPDFDINSGFIARMGIRY